MAFKASKTWQSIDCILCACMWSHDQEAQVLTCTCVSHDIEKNYNTKGYTSGVKLIYITGQMNIMLFLKGQIWGQA